MKTNKSNRAIAIDSSIANINGKVNVTQNRVFRGREEKFYRVFISGTFEDLQKEREEVMKVLLESSYMPAGMEFFRVLDDKMFQLIMQYIDTCDYYIVIIKNRYGKIYKNKMSYTEAEYRYAADKNIPRLALLFSDSAPDDERLTRFRAFVESDATARHYWKNEIDLVKRTIYGMNDVISQKGARGWVRGEWETPPTLVGENLADDRTELKTQHEPALLDEDSVRKLEEALQEYENKNSHKAFTFLLGERSDTFAFEREKLLTQGARSVLNQFMGILERGGISTPRPVEPEFAFEALAAVEYVSDPKMQEYWATFLANAVDPRFEKEKVRLDFIGVLRGMIALDIDILNHIASSLYDSDRLDYIFETFSKDKGIVGASICRLTKDSLINIPSVPAYGGLSKFDITDPRTHYLFNRAKITLQGEEFLRAVSPPDKPEND
jgi:hypothetical protein